MRFVAEVAVVSNPELSERLEELGLRIAYISLPVPDEVWRRAAGSRLGAYVATFPPGKRWFLLIWEGLFGLLMVCQLCALALVAIDVYGADPVVVWPTFAMLCLGLIALALLPALTGPLLSAKARSRKFYVFQQGLVHVGRKGTEVYRFDAVTSVQETIDKIFLSVTTTRTSYKLDLRLADGRRLQLNTYSTDMATFAPLLQREVAKAQVPPALEQLAAGATQRFGPFLITNAGVANDGAALLPWSRVQSVIVAMGYVVVRQTGTQAAWAGAKGRGRNKPVHLPGPSRPLRQLADPRRRVAVGRDGDLAAQFRLTLHEPVANSYIMRSGPIV
jgi:hypothetical protein